MPDEPMLRVVRGRDAMTLEEQARVTATLTRIADALDAYPMPHGDDVGALVTETPAAFVVRMVNRDVPPADRTAVIQALPPVMDRDWDKAARQLRDAASRVQRSSI